MTSNFSKAVFGSTSEEISQSEEWPIKPRLADPFLVGWIGAKALILEWIYSVSPCKTSPFKLWFFKKAKISSEAASELLTPYVNK